jgi:hypothetical protein
MFLSPALVEFRAVHLLAWRTGITGGHNRMVFIDNDRTKVPAKACALMGTPECEVKEIVVSVCPHS